ncbi:MAG: pyridoxamine 5'-phosphate oxidase family protein [Thermoguttaceae bacterium]|jgi:nitroimidazol reductase NimA-like FMN-containing flavoprotein (pyridoxamine 5'-phosphate oxidase superfamily)|nr:pyridoxamine 5'-phosphate oxidase family protein [Thermoguttaceae bacterium]
MDETYHLRRVERDMPDRAEQLAVLRAQKYLSLAMCRDNQPYLVSLNYAFSEEEHCFYVHSAPEGRKLDYLRANPKVFGQVIEDRGYVVGKCAHAYRSVMFQARAEFVEAIEEKRRALSQMIDHADPDPAPLRERLVATSDLKHVVVLRLVIEWMTGKQGA